MILSSPSLTAAAFLIAPATRLSAPDLAIVALYLIGITLFGLRFSKKNKQQGASSLKTYFLADNTIPWWAIALSIVSAETSTLTIVSIPGVAFGGDFGFLQIVLGYMIGRIVVAALFLPRYFRGEMLTAYQLIRVRFSNDRRFGQALYKVTAGLFLLTRAAAEGVRVFAISIVVGIAIGTGDTLSIFIISALTLLYTFEGGMAAVIWTDVVQMALYVAGTLVALFTLGHQVPGGWSHIHAVAAPLGKFHWLNFSLNLTQTYTFWAGILGGTFLTMASHGTDQLMVQRMLAARNLRESRLALLSSGVVIFFQFTLFLLIGVGLFVFYGYSLPHGPGTMTLTSSSSAIIAPPLLSPDRIFPTFIVTRMPHGIAGLLVAAILAAAMSNLSAALNSLSSTTVVDFYLPFLQRHRIGAPSSTDSPIVGQDGVSSEARTLSSPELPSPNTTFISRLATVFWAVILFAIAVYSIQHGGKGHVVETGLSIASVAYGCLLGVFLLGTLTKYATQSGTIIGMILGFALNLTLWLPTITPIRRLGPFLIPHVAFTWYVLLGALVTFAAGTLFSLLLPKPRRTAATIFILCLFLGAPSFSQSYREKGGVSGEARPLSSTTPKSVILSERSESKDPEELKPVQAARTTQPQIPSPTPTYDFSPVSALIESAISQKKLPGAVLLIGHNNRIVFHHPYGLRKLAGEPGPDGTPSPAEPMTEDTIFDMASLSKVISTTTAILQLYEQKKLDLDTPVATYLPDFATVATTPGAPSSRSLTAQGAVSSEARPLSSTQGQLWKSQITIRQLLTHYSGLPEDVSLKDPWGLAAPDKPEGIRRALAAVPYGPPGLTFKYSDINFITLGALVEKLSGLRLDLYAQKFIFDPLQMDSTRYHPFDQVCGPHTISGSAVELRLKLDPAAGYGCSSNIWNALSIPRTAPTAHDDESKLNPSLNPNFDHLLRGTVHDPTTRRMGGVAGHAGVFSTAADAARFCQALLDKLTHNTGPFPLTQATLRLAVSPQAPATAVTDATIFLQDGTPTKGIAERGLGWDLNTAFSRPRGTIFPITTAQHPGSFGHTGFTGTSLWLDPTSNTFVILLANAIHPRGGTPISPLRGTVATATAQALGITTSGAPSFPGSHPGRNGVSSEARPSSSLIRTNYESRHPERSAAQSKDPESASLAQPARTTQPQTSKPQTLTGIDVLEQTNFAALKSLPHQGPTLRIALLTNQSGLDRNGLRTVDILLHASPDITLTTLFSPEHGLYGRQDTETLQKESDPITHLPVISVFGPKPSDKHPRQSDLKQVDAVVIDLQDAGVRFWTYETLVGYFLEATAHAHIPLVILDRPNPIGGLASQGPTSDLGFESTYVDFMPLPLRHGLTLGELARYFNQYGTEIQLKPELLNAEATVIGTPTAQDPGNQLPPATQPGLHADLHVIAMQNWTRGQFYADTALPWVPPSPNLKTPRAAILYPALGMTEYNNISVGRGTPTPFENLGAPWIKSEELAAYLTARNIPGVIITPTTMTIAEDSNHYPSHGQTIPALHFEVTNRTTLDTPELGLELLSALHHLYPRDFKLTLAKNLIANAATLAAITAGTDPRDIAAAWQPALTQFRLQSTPLLLYPR